MTASLTQAMGQLQRSGKQSGGKVLSEPRTGVEFESKFCQRGNSGCGDLTGTGYACVFHLVNRKRPDVFSGICAVRLIDKCHSWLDTEQPMRCCGRACRARSKKIVGLKNINGEDQMGPPACGRAALGPDAKLAFPRSVRSGTVCGFGCHKAPAGEVQRCGGSTPKRF